MNNHSPGPWIYVESSSTPVRAAVLDRDGHSVAALLGLSSGKQMSVNGMLLAAAPDLLKACKLALSSCAPHENFYHMICSAIAKAEGNQ